MNDLYSELSSQNQNQTQNNYGVLGQLYQFAQNFKGNPETQVKQLLQNGGRK